MLPEEIKQQRLFLNLTQAELAEKLSISTQTLSNWETGRTEPDAPKMLELALHHLVWMMPRSEKHKQFIAQCQASIEESRAVLRREAERRRVRKSA
jgi:transcriptional regulator with XRE-family HTH domain